MAFTSNLATLAHCPLWIAKKQPKKRKARPKTKVIVVQKCLTLRAAGYFADVACSKVAPIVLPGSTTFSLELPVLVAGSYTLDVTAVDGAGNEDPCKLIPTERRPDVSRAASPEPPGEKRKPALVATG